MRNIIKRQVVPGGCRKVVEIKPSRVQLLIVIHVGGVVLVYVLNELKNQQNACQYCNCYLLSINVNQRQSTV